MRTLMFAVGSLVVAVCSPMLLFAALSVIFLKRPLSDTELAMCLAGSVVVGVAWWVAVRRKLRQRRSGGFS